MGRAGLAGTRHGLLYAVVMGPSSAALVLPVLEEAGIGHISAFVA